MSENEPTPDGARFAAGEMVDHFRVIRLLGRGGFGDVYLARDTKLGRKVALKVVHPRYLRSDTAAQSFMFEARATARFSHPHIVTIYEVGEHRGAPYVALEYLPGGSLRDRLRGGPLGLGQVLRIGLAVAEAVQEAHNHGILHRDLKPENILIPTDGRPRVVDFGLAKPTASTLTSPPAIELRSPVAGAASEVDVSTSDTLAQALPGSASEVDVSTSDTLAQALPGADTLVEVYHTLGGGGAIYGSPGYMAPEQWRAHEPGEGTDVWALGVTLYEMITGRLPHAAATLQELGRAVCSPDPAPALQGADLPDTLRELVGACLRKQGDQRAPIGRVVEGLRQLQEAGRQLPKDQEGTGPFRGLLPFGEEHAAYFFGRETEIDAFVERLRGGSATIVLCGPSGAGKSSFVQAGVIPRLREQGRWTVVKLRPGASPFRTLAARLRGGDSAASVTLPAPRQGPDQEPGPVSTLPPRTDEDHLAEALIDAPARLGLMLRQLAEAGGGRVLLFVDQLEELYTQVESLFVRRRFMEALALAADDLEEPVRVVLALRDDFLGRVAEAAEARSALERVVVIQRPGRDALVETLLRPLEAAGYRFEEPGMVEEMVESVGGEPAGLPLLQFTARMLWERRDRKRRLLLSSVHRELGGVPGALATHADQVIDGLSPVQLGAAREVLLRLVTAEGTRRTLSRSRLLDGLGAEASVVADRLVAHRLLAARRRLEGGDDATGLELAHESLIVNWARLARWLDQSQEERSFLAEAGQAAELWRRRGRSQQEVWRGAALADAQRSLGRCRTNAPEEVRRFIAAGERRERRGRRVRAAGLIVVVTVVIAAMTIWALTVTKKEEYARMQSSLAQLESARVQQAAARYDEARAYLRGSLELQDSREARRLWWRLKRQLQLWTHEFEGPVDDASVAADSRRAAVAVRDNPVYLLDLTRHTARALPAKNIVTLDLSADGLRLATGGDNGEVRVWDLATGESLQLRRPGKPRSIRSLRWDVGERALLFVVHDTVHRVWLGGGAPPSSIKGENTFGVAPHAKGARFIAGYKSYRIHRGFAGSSVPLEDAPMAAVPAVFSPDATLLAVGDVQRHQVQIFDAGTGRVIARFPVQRQVHGIAISHDNRKVALTRQDGQVEVWDLERRTVIHRSGQLHDRPSTAVFAPDGRLLTGGFRGRLVLWNAGLPPTVPAVHASEVAALSFPSGRRLLSADLGGELILWDLEGGFNTVRPTDHRGGIRDLAVSPDGALLATAGGDGKIGIWEAATFRRLRRLVGHNGPVVGLAFGPDSRRLASAGLDRTVRLWDARTGDEERRIQPRSKVNVVSFNPDGSLLSVSGGMRRVQVYDPKSGELRWESRPQNPALQALFTDRGTLAVRGAPGEIVEHYPPSKREPRLLLEGYDMLSRLVISGPYIARGSSNAYCPLCGAKVVDTARDRTQTLWGHRFPVGHAAIAPDGKLVATSSGASIRLWRISDGVPRWRIPFLDTTPPRLFTDRGVIDLRTGARVPPERALQKRWERAVWSRGRLARSRGSAVCLHTHRGRVELWDRSSDRRLFQRRVARVRELLVAGDGCLAQTAAGVFLHREAGTRRLAASSVQGLSIQGDEIFVVENSWLRVFDFNGTPVRRRTLPKEVTAVLKVRGGLYVGFWTGKVSLIPDSAGGVGGQEQVSGEIRVRRIIPGVANTLVVVRTEAVSIYDRDNRREWLTEQLAGPIVHAAMVGTRLYVATDVNDWRVFDLSVLTKPRCELLREMWREAPKVPVGDRLVSRPPDSSHECLE